MSIELMPAEWNVVRNLALGPLLANSGRMRDSLTSPRHRTLLAEVTWLIGRGLESCGSMEDLRKSWLRLQEAAWSVALENRPHPLHLQVLEDANIRPEELAFVLPELERMVAERRKIIAPATPSLLLRLLKDGYHLIVKPMREPEMELLEDTRPLLNGSMGTGVIASWVRGPWTVEDLSRATIQLEMERSGIILSA